MIHQYMLNGYYIVLDVNSGAVHIMDELSYKIVEQLDEKMLPECPQRIVNTLSSRYPEEDI